MASEHGSPPGGLEVLQHLEEEPWSFGFFRAVRLLDCAHPDKPATGTSFRPSDDAVRFGQDPFTEFAPATIHAYEQEESGRPRLVQRFLGLFGPDGPLPMHMTEYARDRQRQNRDPTLTRFADLFHHRMISLYYRAWANAQPTVQLDQPETDRLGFYVGSFIGLGSEAVVDADAMHHMAKLGMAAQFGSLSRHADGLEAVLEEYFEVPVQVTEFIAHWLRLPERDHLLLGGMGTGRLGMDTVIGERCWQRQDKFRVTLGPLSLDDYTAFLPNGKYFDGLLAAVHNYAGLEMFWELNLVLMEQERPVTCLGKSGKLGWTSWLETGHSRGQLDDLLLQVQNYLH